MNPKALIMKIKIFLIVLCLPEIFCDQTHRHALKEKFHWGNLDFKFPNATIRNVALSTGSYIPENNNIWGMAIWNDKIFISLLRLKVGVASSLNYFSKYCETKSPELIPYPSFDVNYVSEDPQRPTITLPSQSSIISAGYLHIDKYDRLWLPDTGLVDIYGDKRVLSPPALVVYNLKTNKLIRRYTIPAAFVNSNSVFTNLALDFAAGDDCDDVFVYMVDEFRQIVVYSYKNNRSWNLVHSLFGSDPNDGIFNFEGRSIQWNFGIIGIILGKRESDGSRRVYLHPFSSTKSYYISNAILKNETYIALNDYFCDVHLLGDRGENGQIFTWVYDKKTNVVFDAQFYRQRIGCWNTANPYTNSSFAIAYKKKRPFFTADVVIDRNRNLWVVSNSLFKFVFGLWNADVKNIQIFKGKVDDIISGTICQHKLPKSKYPKIEPEPTCQCPA